MRLLQSDMAEEEHTWTLQHNISAVIGWGTMSEGKIDEW